MKTSSGIKQPTGIGGVLPTSRSRDATQRKPPRKLRRPGKDDDGSDTREPGRKVDEYA